MKLCSTTKLCWIELFFVWFKDWRAVEARLELLELINSYRIQTQTHITGIYCVLISFFVRTAVQQKHSQRNLLVHLENIVFFYM